MSDYPTYRLCFRAPVHIGERGVGLEVTRTHIPADTLFSAICSGWRLLYGAEALLRDVLDWFTEDGSAPFFLTSAYPYAGPVRFFPRPMGKLPNVRIGDREEKRMKRVRFVSENIFRAIVSNEPLAFRAQDSINNGAAWIAAETEDRARLDKWTDGSTGDIVLWKVSVVPRVTLDRMTSASEIWHFGKVTFQEGCGLWFAVQFNPDHGDELRRRFEAVLRLLGDAGLGGERGAGYGLFTVDGVQEEPIPEIEQADRFVTLAPLCPGDNAEAGRILTRESAYELIPRRGWIGSPEGQNLRRKTVWMLAEGSILQGPSYPRMGRLVDVTPEVLTAHRVYRYGYAFPAGVSRP